MSRVHAAPLRILLGAVLAAAFTATLAAPATAAPGFAVTAFQVGAADGTPLRAGAHQDIRVTTGFTPYELGSGAPPQARNVTVHLPPGLLGNPLATSRCSEAAFRADACAKSSRVGSVAVDSTVEVAGLPVAVAATGDVFNLVPLGADPARLGIVVRPDGNAVIGKFLISAPVSLRIADGGLDTTIVDLPRTLSGLNVWVRSMRLTLEGRPAGATAPFMVNPTSCSPARSSVEATAYGAGAQPVRRDATFTPVACDRLPFAPQIVAVMSGGTAVGSHPGFRSTVTYPADQANGRAVTVRLPAQLAIASASLTTLCKGPQLTNGCPAGSRIGSALVQTSVLPTALTGAVYVASLANGSPGLAVRFDGAIPLALDGALTVGAAGLSTTFTGLPDVPLQRFELTIAGGPKGALAVGRDLCRGGYPTIAGTFDGYNGATATSQSIVRVTGCSRRPLASLRLTGGRTARPSVRLVVLRSRAGTAIRQVRLTLPADLRVARSHVAAGLRVTADGHRLASPKVSLSRSGVLRVVGLPATTVRVQADLGGGAIVPSNALTRRRRLPTTLPFALVVQSTDGFRASYSLTRVTGPR